MLRSPLAGYLPYTRYTYNISTTGAEDAAVKIKQAQILHCPSKAVFGRESSGYRYLTDYGLNYCMITLSEAAPLRLSKVNKPDRLIWAADTDIQWFSNHTTNGLWGRNGFRHRNLTINVLWAQGHVSTKHRNELNVQPGDPGPSNVYVTQSGGGE